MPFAPSHKKQFFFFRVARAAQSIKAGIAIAMLAGLSLAACGDQDDDQTAIVSTLAGGKQGFADGQGHNAQFSHPSGIAVDAVGNLYVADHWNNRIRKITPKGEVSTFAGSGKEGFADGQGSAAWFNQPSDIAIDATGNLYVADVVNHSIRKITPKGEVSTLADNGNRDFADGQESAARLYGPSGIAIDAAGNLYVAETAGNLILKVTPEGEVRVLAGGSESGLTDGQGYNARFDMPSGITIDRAGNLYVADTFNHRIRKVTLRGEVSTLAGGGSTDHDGGGFADGKGRNARFGRPSGIAIDAAGNLYVTDTKNHRIRKVTPRGEVSTIAGDGEQGSADGKGSAAQFKAPSGIAVDSAGNLYVADTNNHRIRKIVIQRP